MTESDRVLDARGLTCPLPILRAKKALRSLGQGVTLTVLATDPATFQDFQAFCRQTGDVLLESTQQSDGSFFYRIQKQS